MAFTLAACLKHNESPEEKSGAGEKPPGAACFFRYYVGKLWKSIGSVRYLKCSLIKRLAEKEIVCYSCPRFVSPGFYFLSYSGAYLPKECLSFCATGPLYCADTGRW